MILASQIDLISTLNLFVYAPVILEYHRVIYLSTGRLLQWMILKYVIHKMLKSSKTTLLCINSPSQPILMFKEGFLFIHCVCKLNPFETKSNLTSIVNILYTPSIWEDGGSVESIEQSMCHPLVLSTNVKQIQWLKHVNIDVCGIFSKDEAYFM